MTNRTEQWRPVVGYEGLYEVSNQGRVRGMDRTVLHGRHGTVRARGKVIRQTVSDSGHKRVGLTVGAQKARLYVHRLVLEAFVGPCPDGMEACHNNGIPDDNRVENLRWDTRKANQHDKVTHGTVYQANKSTCPRGHALTGKNLKPDALRKGYRTCLACARARNRKYNLRARHKLEMSDRELQAVSDQYYLDLAGL